MRRDRETIAGLDVNLLRRFVPYLRRYAVLAAVSFLLMVGTNVAAVLEPYFLKVGIDRDVAQRDWQGLLQTATALGVVLVLGFVLQFFFNYGVQFLGQRLLYDIRMDLFGKVLRLPNTYFDRTPVGTTLTHLTSDVEAVRAFISEGVVTVLGELLKVVLIFAAMVWVNARLALLALLVIPFFLLATVIFRKSIRGSFREVRRANAEINTHLVESITGVNEIHLFNYERQGMTQFVRANQNYLNAFLRVVHSYSVYFPVIDVVTNVGMGLVMLYAHFQMGVGIQPGEIFVFFAYIQMFFRPLRQLAEKFNMFQSAMAAAERIFTLLDREEPPRPLEVRSAPRPAAGKDWGDVAFRHVHFSYQEGQPVLKDLDFTIGHGEKIALVGTTGSGKTTVGKLLTGLYEIDSGEIRIGGVDIRRLPLPFLRRQVTTVPQDVFLFTGSAGENISMYDPDIDTERVRRAARTVYAHRFIERLPGGYGESLLEEGKSLSTGQRQLLGFARAFVRESPIVVLDEVTANVDAETESLIEGAIGNLIGGRTAIIIAHRLATIRMVDRILVLHRGELIEQGTHRELMRKNGLYAQYYRMQSILSGI